ncbi:hypothetical protein EAG21025_18500 [Enterobacter asburiae]
MRSMVNSIVIFPSTMNYCMYIQHIYKLILRILQRFQNIECESTDFSCRKNQVFNPGGNLDKTHLALQNSIRILKGWNSFASKTDMKAMS